MARPSQKIPSVNVAGVLQNITVNQLLYTVLLVSSFLLGYLFAKVQVLEGGTTTVGTAPTAQTADATNPGAPAPGTIVDVEEGHLPVLGKKDAKVTIVEFGDLQCPFCRSYFNTSFQQIKKEYIDTGKVKYYFRHYPLPFHAMAKPAAMAVECANEQGKFWELHDLIYVEQEKQGQGTIDFTNDDLKTWAANAGLNTGQFNQCLDSGKYASVVDEDMQAGNTAGVSGTPTFFINGEMIVGAQPFDSFKALIDKNLN